MIKYRKRPSDFSQAATLDFKRDHPDPEGVKTGQYHQSAVASNIGREDSIASLSFCFVPSLLRNVKI
jgi:hypothetical protein